MHFRFFIVVLLIGCDAPVARVAPTPPTPPAIVDAGVVVVVAPPPAEATVAVKPAAATTREIAVFGPDTITWKGLTNRVGDGKVSVRSSATFIVAVDAKRGSTHEVPIADGLADFSALPRGELVVHTSPQTTLFIANESIGTAPLDKAIKLPVGDYTVKLVLQDKVKTARVNVTADAKAEIRMKMTE